MASCAHGNLWQALQIYAPVLQLPNESLMPASQPAWQLSRGKVLGISLPVHEQL